MRLAGKRAIVTGAARGIGRAIAGRFVAEGARVLAVSRSIESSKPDSDLIAATADISRAGDVARIVALAEEKFGGLDILVNNAGLQLEKTIEDTSEDEWDRLMATNLKGVFLCMRAAIPLMRRAGGGSIVNLGSYEAMASDPRLACYVASKGGVHALSRAVAVDHGKDQIRCNVIAPGWIATGMTEAYLDSYPDPAAARAGLARIHPIGRIGTPADIANIAAWLASDDASFVTGQIIAGDGGMTAMAPQPA